MRLLRQRSQSSNAQIVDNDDFSFLFYYSVIMGKTMEDFKKKLKKEGFKHVYEWTDSPGTKYPAHAHNGKVSFYVTKGSMTMNLEGKKVTIIAGERMDVPVGMTHSATVGSQGCTFIVGEEIRDDS